MRSLPLYIESMNEQALINELIDENPEYTIKDYLEIKAEILAVLQSHDTTGR